MYVSFSHVCNVSQILELLYIKGCIFSKPAITQFASVLAKYSTYKLDFRLHDSHSPM